MRNITNTKNIARALNNKDQWGPLPNGVRQYIEKVFASDDENLNKLMSTQPVDDLLQNDNELFDTIIECQQTHIIIISHASRDELPLVNKTKPPMYKRVFKKIKSLI